MKKGTLVRVSEEALKEAAEEHNGRLWVLQRIEKPSYSRAKQLYICKSLATGEFYAWFLDELEVANQEEEGA